MNILFAASFVFLSCAGPLLAATLNFADVRPGVVSKPVEFPTAAVIESGGGSLFVYGSGKFGMPASGGVCGLQSDFSCTGDISLLFIGPVSNLSFSGHDASVSDRAVISVYSGNTLLSVVLASGNPDGAFDVDFDGFSGITRLQIADRSSLASRGIAYGGFAFDLDPVLPPLPAPPPLEVINFDGFRRGPNDGLLDLGIGSVRTTDGSDLFVYRSGDFDIPQNGAICAYTAEATCQGDFVMEFRVPIFDLTFSGFFAKITDAAFISLFDGDSMIFDGQFFGNSVGTILFDFRQFGKLTKIMVRDASDRSSKGIAYGDFKYRVYEVPEPPVPPVSPVPLPPAVLFLAGGLTGLWMLRRGDTRRAV